MPDFFLPLAGAAFPSASAFSLSIRFLSSPSGSASVFSSAAMMSLIASMESRIREIASGVTSSSPSRIFPSTFSDACATDSRRANPRNPQVPLTVWTSRKMLPSSPLSFGFCSNWTSSTSSSARLSELSIRNSRSRSSIVVTSLLRSSRDRELGNPPMPRWPSPGPEKLKEKG